ncbi:MAG: GH116 family glycosyl-hydrolase, partial [Candidatus Omnitrophica bacterium]|nr:GH116 family glycosyl-hydrolase [Candidatus Omnitrophota bacterium]
MKRRCNCSGACAGESNSVSRREFIALVGAGTAGVLLTGPVSAAPLDYQLPASELEQWTQSLTKPASPRLYRSDVHTDARMHLGGIGTGNFEIGVDGQFTTWQLFNTLRDGLVPFHFVIKAGATTKLLQTAGGPDWPRVDRIEMTGEYPVAILRFLDSAIPVQVQLTAFSPFAPLDTALSSVPVAYLVFRLHNPTTQTQRVSLGALMQNAVGYEAVGKIDGNRHPNFGGNINECIADDHASFLVMRAKPAQEPSLDKSVAVYTNLDPRGLNAPPDDRPANLTVRLIGRQPLSAKEMNDPAHTVIWLEEARADLAEGVLRAAREAVMAGATLLFSGKSMPLLESYARATGGKPLAQAQSRPDILFDDFEHGYDKWTVNGQAFGAKPAAGTLPNQQPVSGFLGGGLVNSFLEGDQTTGRLVSKSFVIERRYIHFLVGGGSHQNTQIRLIVGDKAVRRASGHDNELLLPASWDVSELEGKTAHLEIVDEETGGWGHINIDQIEFSDRPSRYGVLELLDELLPGRFSEVRPESGEPGKDSAAIALIQLELKPDARQASARGGLPFLARSAGAGQVIVALGPVLEPSQSEFSSARQRAYALLCEWVGAHYTPAKGILPNAPGFGTLALAAWAQKTTVLPA